MRRIFSKCDTSEDRSPFPRNDNGEVRATKETEGLARARVSLCAPGAMWDCGRRCRAALRSESKQKGGAGRVGNWASEAENSSSIITHFAARRSTNIQSQPLISSDFSFFLHVERLMASPRAPRLSNQTADFEESSPFISNAIVFGILGNLAPTPLKLSVFPPSFLFDDSLPQLQLWNFWLQCHKWPLGGSPKARPVISGGSAATGWNLWQKRRIPFMDITNSCWRSGSFVVKYSFEKKKKVVSSPPRK